MELTHSFTVPVDVATTWAAFEDVSSVAACFPGAVVTSAEGDRFEGTCKVKLGPVALQYAGSGTFLERDVAAGRLVLEAKGRDKRGNGTAGAHVTAVLTEAAAGSTHVEVRTDLQITGKPAQFGRGVIQDVSDKLLAQFVDCLQSKVAVPAEAFTAPSAVPGADTADAPATEQPPAQPSAGPQEALDLGATVLPALLRSYGKQAGAVVLLLLLLTRIVRRRRS